MDPLPEGTRAIVDQAIEGGAQTLFSAADVPLKRADELLAALQGAAMRAVMEARVEQIVKHGHGADQDAMQPIGWLPTQAASMLQAARDLIPPGDKRNLPVARLRLARTAALLLAAIDRIDFEEKHQRGEI